MAALRGTGIPQDPYLIGTLEDLREFSQAPDAPARYHAAGVYTAMADHVDCTEMETWNGGTGFKPIPNYAGIFDGKFRNIHKFFSSKTDSLNPNAGFFHSTQTGSQFKNLSFTDLFLKSNQSSGIGYASLVNVPSSGLISHIAILSGTIESNGNTYNGSIAGQAATGDVNMSQCYSYAHVISDDGAGGLVGRVGTGSVTECFFAGTFTSLYGNGVVGHGITAPTSYYDTTLAGIRSNDGGIGKTTSQMKMQSTYIGWNFDDVWFIEDGKYPQLRSFIPLAITADPTVINAIAGTSVEMSAVVSGGVNSFRSWEESSTLSEFLSNPPEEGLEIIASHISCLSSDKKGTVVAVVEFGLISPGQEPWEAVYSEYVCVSKDKGLSWGYTLLLQFTAFEGKAVSVGLIYDESSDSFILFLSRANVLFTGVSEDQGSTWTFNECVNERDVLFEGEPTGEKSRFYIHRNKMACGNGTLFVVGHSNGNGSGETLAISSDRGVSWSFPVNLPSYLPHTLRTMTSIAFGNGIILITISSHYSVTENSYFRSTDLGSTWQEISLPPLLPQSYASVQSWQSVSYDNGLWAMTTALYNVIIISLDDGLTWSVRDIPVLSGRSAGFGVILVEGSKIIALGSRETSFNDTPISGSTSLNRGDTWASYSIPYEEFEAIAYSGTDFWACQGSGRTPQAIKTVFGYNLSLIDTSDNSIMATSSPYQYVAKVGDTEFKWVATDGVSTVETIIPVSNYTPLFLIDHPSDITVAEGSDLDLRSWTWGGGLPPYTIRIFLNGEELGEAGVTNDTTTSYSVGECSLSDAGEYVISVSDQEVGGVIIYFSPTTVTIVEKNGINIYDYHYRRFR